MALWGKNHYQHHDEDNGTLRQDERLGRGFPRRRPALFLHFNICWLSHVYWERHNVMTHVTIERNMTHQVIADVTNVNLAKMIVSAY